MEHQLIAQTKMRIELLKRGHCKEKNQEIVSNSNASWRKYLMSLKLIVLNYSRENTFKMSGDNPKYLKMSF